MIYPLTALATVLALVVYVVLSIGVGRARTTFGVPAPAMGGHVEFEKRLRVQLNTLEQLALFVPSLWLAAPVVGDEIAALAGLVWSVGRIIYAVTYVRDPKTRSAGFALTMLPSLFLLVAAAKGAVMMMLAE